MNKHSKKIIPLLIIISVATFLLIRPTKTRNELATEEIEKQKTKHVDKSIKQNKVSRTVASIPSPQNPLKKREIVGRASDLSNVTIINKESKNWKEVYSKNFLRMLGDKKVKDFKIKLKKSILKVNKNVGQQMEHIVVSYTRPNGNPSSFEALVD